MPSRPCSAQHKKCRAVRAPSSERRAMWSAGLNQLRGAKAAERTRKEARKVALEPELAGWREEPVRLHSEYGRRYHKQVEELAALVQSEEDKQDSRLFAGWLTGSFSRLNGANSESTCMGLSN
jgi:hypothetical protein